MYGYDFRDGNTLVATNFQIVNGAQTIGALTRAPANADVSVLFRLTKTLNVKTDKGINSEIIRFNNSQNVVKLSDFRSNDEIQRWLERRFKEHKWATGFANITYAAKRGAVLKRVAGARNIGLEELAKIRYAFNVEPTLVSAAPKDLWTSGEDSGKYETAFGVNGELLNAWPDHEFQTCLQAIGFYLLIDEQSRKEGREYPEMRYLTRLRFHGLALAGIFARSTQASSLPVGERGAKEAWDKVWPKIRDVLIDTHVLAVDEQNQTMFAFVRSTDRWAGMQKRFTQKLKLKPQQPR